MIRCELVPVPGTFKIDSHNCYCRACDVPTEYAVRAIGYDYIFACCGATACVDAVKAQVETAVAAANQPARYRSKPPWHWFSDRPDEISGYDPLL